MKWLLLTLVFMPMCLMAENLRNESFYQSIIAKNLNGSEEVQMSDGTRCDIVTESHAIEVDFAKKWSEAVGQSLFYSVQINKKSGIVLILEKDTDRKYLIRLGTVVREFDLPIRIWTINASGELKQEN